MKTFINHAFNRKIDLENNSWRKARNKDTERKP